MAIFIAEDFRSLLDAMDAASPTEESEVINEAPMTKQQAVATLAQIRSIAKDHERTDQGPLPGNFANQVAEALWPVIAWLQHLPEPQQAE